MRTRTFMTRTNTIHRHCFDRARKLGVKELPYTLEDFRQLVEKCHECPYCDKLLYDHNFSLDHVDPIARGGSWELHNLAICCMRCNKIKGSMTCEEFISLLAVINTFPIEVQKELLNKIYSGGRFFR